MAFRILNHDGSDSGNQYFTARDFRADNLQENPFTQSFSFGKMDVKQWILDDIQITYSETELNDFAGLDWEEGSEMITMHFNFQGRISIKDGTFNHQLSGNDHNIFYRKEGKGTIKFDELKMTSFMILLSKESFLEIAKKGNDSIKRFAANVESGNPIAFSERNGNIDLSLQQCINSVLNCNLSPGLKKMFFYSKVIEILALQADSLERAMQEKPLYIKTEYDKERLLFARDYLIQNIDFPPTLAELSRIAGINEYKLKNGFKEVFGQPVFEYLSDVRLDLARNELLQKKKTVGQIAFELGYSSLQHFSSAFKKKYGISPSKVD